MPINNLTTSNTFGQWLDTTNALVNKFNFVEQANSDAQTANVNTQIANTNAWIARANAITANTNAWIAYDTIFNYVQTANNTANLALQTSGIAVNVAQGAYDSANVFLTYVANNSNLALLTNDTTTDNDERYLVFSRDDGVLVEGFISKTKLFYNPLTGTVYATNFNSLSDENKKKDIETIQNALDTVMKLRGVTFKWKENDISSMGLIAQEIEKIVPEVVTTNNDGEKSVIYGNMIGLLIESIKDLKKEIDELKQNKE